MSFTSEKDGEARRRPEDSRDSGGGGERSGGKKRRGAAPEIGNALRAAYDQTVDEAIPPEMLDLLGKLG